MKRQMLSIHHSSFTLHHFLERAWRNGSALASQAKGCEFESRRPLQSIQYERVQADLSFLLQAKRRIMLPI